MPELCWAGCGEPGSGTVARVSPDASRIVRVPLCRRVVATPSELGAMSTHLETELVLALLNMAGCNAAAKASSITLDRGTQYTSSAVGLRCRETRDWPSDDARREPAGLSWTAAHGRRCRGKTAERSPPPHRIRIRTTTPS